MHGPINVKLLTAIPRYMHRVHRRDSIPVMSVRHYVCPCWSFRLFISCYKLSLFDRSWARFYVQSVSTVLINHNFMSLYGYMYFTWDHLHSTFYTSVRCSNYVSASLQSTIIILKIHCTSCFVLLIHGLPDVEL